MNQLYLAAAASFIAGMCGYIIVRYWLIPIRRYRKVKSKLVAEIDQLDRLLREQGDGGAAAGPGSGLRAKAVKLLDLHRYELPYWYRLVLVRRRESPENAFAAIMKLEKCSGPEFSRHLETAKTNLGILQKDVLKG